MKDKKLTYTLTMSADQCHAVCEAVEFLMRLKMAQVDEIPRHVLEWGDGLSCDEWCRRRDEAEPLLQAAFRVLFPSWTEAKRDNRLYDLYQVTRKAIHDAEHPETTGVDSYPLMCTAGEPMATCTWQLVNANTIPRAKGGKQNGFHCNFEEEYDSEWRKK